jgi:uncharacterized protein
MSKKNRSTNKIIANSLVDLASTISTWQSMTGGSTLSSYGTIENSNNYAMMTINWVVLSYLYAGNGIFQRAIRLPVLDALSKGFKINSDEASKEEIDEVMKWFRENKLKSIIKQFKIWCRLFGGGAIIINTNQDPGEEFDIKQLKNSPLKFYAVNRWQLASSNYSFDYIENVMYDLPENEFYYLFGKKIHKSRVLLDKGEEAPHYLARRLRGWGMSEGERIIRDLNLYLKTQDVLYEILDESKVDVFYVEGLANKLATLGGTTNIQNRIRAMNEIKNYLNAVLLDATDKFEQKTLSFGGLSEVMNQNRLGIAAAINFPMTKLFGMSSAGFNSGEDDLENYNSMIESEIREPLKDETLPMLVDMAFMVLHGYIPQYDIEFPPLRIMTAEQEEQIKTSKANRILMFFDRGLIQADKTIQWAQKEDIIGIDVGYVPPKVEPNFPQGQGQPGQQEQLGMDTSQGKTVNVTRKQPQQIEKPQTKKPKFNIFNRKIK